VAAVTFDTLKSVQTLETAGVVRDQAVMELGLRKDIDMLRNELIIKLSAVMIACVGVIGLMIRFM